MTTCESKHVQLTVSNKKSATKPALQYLRYFTYNTLFSIIRMIHMPI